MTEQMGAAQAVIDAVGQVAFGAAVTFENLSMVPLLRDDAREADYVTLDEALISAGMTSTHGSEITMSLMEAISLLKEPAQSVARLRLLEGKTFAAIGRALRQPTETVKTIYYRNIDKLRRAIR